MNIEKLQISSEQLAEDFHNGIPIVERSVDRYLKGEAPREEYVDAMNVTVKQVMRAYQSKNSSTALDSPPET